MAFRSAYSARWRDDSAPLKLSFHAAKKHDAEEWKKKLREKVVELLGGFPHDREPLSPKLIEQREFPSYRRDKFIFTSRPGMDVFVYLLTPTGRPPFPAVMCVPGHGRGADELVGIDEHGQTTTSPDASAFALKVVEQGAVAVAIEPVGFGCRRDPATKKKGLSATSCDLAANSALLFGETILGWRVYDMVRTLDWIEARPEIDSNRIGYAGVEAAAPSLFFPRRSIHAFMRAGQRLSEHLSRFDSGHSELRRSIYSRGAELGGDVRYCGVDRAAAFVHRVRYTGRAAFPWPRLARASPRCKQFTKCSTPRII